VALVRAGARPGRAILIGAFAVYLVLLVWGVLWKFETPFVGAAWALPRPFKLVPFVASGDAGASEPLELLANLLLFVPFGLYVALLADRWRWSAPRSLWSPWRSSRSRPCSFTSRAT